MFGIRAALVAYAVSVDLIVHEVRPEANTTCPSRLKAGLQVAGNW
jgi:hypothetical protein